jgi:hypothetical protein
MAIFNANDPEHDNFVEPPPSTPLNPNPANPGLADIENLEIRVDGTLIGALGGIITVESITLSFHDQFIRIFDATPAVAQYPQNPTPPAPPVPPEDIITPGVPREPRTATLNASMEVRVIISSGDRTITSIAVYEYTGGRLIEKSETSTDMEFVPAASGDPGGYGIWRMVRHEIIEWQG